jgi:RNA polymerase sigma-70 factor (ECF subfamily)
MVELQQAVERLDPSLKDVVIARTWGGLTLSETAEVLGISTTTAHRRYQEALEHLRNLLNQSET